MDDTTSTKGSGGIGEVVSLQPLMLEDAVKLVRWMIPSHFAEKLIESEQKRMVDEISLLHGWPRGVTTFGESVIYGHMKSRDRDFEDRDFERIVADARATVTKRMANYEDGLARLASTTRRFLSLAHFGKKIDQQKDVEKMRQAGVLIGSKKEPVVNPVAAQLLDLRHQTAILNSNSEWWEFERFIAHLLAFKQNLLKKTWKQIDDVSFRDFHHAAAFAGNVDDFLLNRQFADVVTGLLEVSQQWPEHPSREIQEGKVILNAPQAKFADVIAFHRCHNDTLIVDCVQAKQKGNNASLPMKTEFEKEITKTDDKLNDQVTEELKERFGVSEVKYVFGLVSSGRLTHGRTDMSKNENMESVLCEIMEEQQPKMIDAIYAVDRERLVKWAGPPFANRAQLFSYKNSIDLWNQCAPESGRVEYAEVLGYKGESVEEMGELCKGLPKWKERNGEE
eukprot:TRINITY_DN55_c0_g1_i6.p2 TRINITY_DN55_c0_g1~~TRINITY_DN55_c0_g1_i6.p2  ORF type:complete len:450 (-),score=102.64 TRINITY_DN55_c0_g1_i6:3368-4717(-)